MRIVVIGKCDVIIIIVITLYARVVVCRYVVCSRLLYRILLCKCALGPMTAGRRVRRRFVCPSWELKNHILKYIVII